MKHEIEPKKGGHWKNVNSEHFKTVKAAAVAQILFQTSSECSHIVKAHHRDPPDPINWENIFSAYAYYLPGKGALFVLWGGGCQEQRGFSDKQHSKLFWTSFLDASETFCCQHTPSGKNFPKFLQK